MMHGSGGAQKSSNVTSLNLPGLLTHFLKDKDDLESTHRLNDFLDLLQRNVDPTTAATQAFGDLAQLELDFRKYASGANFAVSEIPGSINVDDSSFVVQPLSQSQADLARADFLAHDDRFSDADTLLQGVLRNDPANVTAREILGYIAFRQEHYDAAQRWCREAIKLDPNSSLAHFFFAAASIKRGMPDKASRASVEESLRAAIKINPSFARAYDALAMFYAMHDSNLSEAYDLIERAVQLVPGAPEIRVDEAQVLATMHKDQEALDALDLALKMSHTPEQVAVVENVRQTLRQLYDERAKARMHNKLVLIKPSISAAGAAPQSTGPVETPPRAIYSPDVEYTDEARKARLEGTCTVSLIVGLDGKPSNVVVTKKVGMGLDERAVQTVSKWKFEPGRRNGKPVMSRLVLNLQFKLVGDDPQKLIDLSQKAQAGDADAEFELANAFFQGQGIPKDEAQGMALLERAARSGHAQAQFQMGERTYGDGNNSDAYVGAYVWYALAQRSGADQADAKVSEVESRMTPEQLAEARKRLENWPTTPQQ